MSVKIAGVTYFSTAELTKELGISRQTLWRWRQEGKIPPGNRYRNRNVLFTTHEVEAIRHFANRIEPIDQPDTEHPQLFDGNQVS
jgi:predicted DNA-binding transcriptional regulator AlpA